jgi:hypothetical protein
MSESDELLANLRAIDAGATPLRTELERLKELPPGEVTGGAVITHTDGQLDAGGFVSGAMPLGKSKWTVGGEASWMKRMGAKAAILFRWRG